MASSLSLGPTSTLGWLQLRPGTNPLQATPGPLALLGIPVEARVTQPGVEAEILRLGVRLTVAETVVGTGEIGPYQLGSYDQQVTATVALARGALPVLLSPPSPHGSTSRVALTLRLSGLLRFRHTLDPATLHGGAPAPNQWHLSPVFDQHLNELDMFVARSDWHEQVISPLRLGDVLTAPLHLPDAARVPTWSGTLDRLADAERALSLGDAAAVFGQCRGAIDALPGDKTNILQAMAPGKARDALDVLVRKVGDYLHTGRHVVPDTGGQMAGEFPVSVDDALFAYNMTRLVLSRIADQVLVEAEQL